MPHPIPTEAIDDESALFEFISSVLREHDPIDLIRMGAPPDEYEPEARDLSRWWHAQCSDGFEWGWKPERVYGVFVGWFGPETCPPVTAPVWQSICRALNEHSALAEGKS